MKLILPKRWIPSVFELQFWVLDLTLESVILLTIDCQFLPIFFVCILYVHWLFFVFSFLNQLYIEREWIKVKWDLHINIRVNINEKSIQGRFVVLKSTLEYNFIILIKQSVQTRYFLKPKVKDDISFKLKIYMSHFPSLR